LYNTSAVAQATGVPADTFRAWERRYTLPRPFRTATNQRLYSERDIGVITWLRDRTTEGMTITQAIQRLRLETPEIFAADQLEKATPSIQERQGEAEPQPVRLQQRLLEACIAFDSRMAERTIDEALARFSIEEFCALVVEPVLTEIGARWSRCELSVATEHFATGLLIRRLSAIFTLVAPVSGRGTIVAACPAGEEHDVGLLMLAILLSRRGWHVVYLGANVPTEDLITATRTIRPDLVCLSVTTADAAREAVAVAQALHAALDQSPPVVVGGYAVVTDDGPLTETIAHILAGSAGDVVDRIGELIERH